MNAIAHAVRTATRHATQQHQISNTSLTFRELVVRLCLDGLHHLATNGFQGAVAVVDAHARNLRSRSLEGKVWSTQLSTLFDTGSRLHRSENTELRPALLPFLRPTTPTTRRPSNNQSNQPTCRAAALAPLFSSNDIFSSHSLVIAWNTTGSWRGLGFVGMASLRALRNSRRRSASSASALNLASSCSECVYVVCGVCVCGHEGRDKR